MQTGRHQESRRSRGGTQIQVAARMLHSGEISDSRARQ